MKYGVIVTPEAEINIIAAFEFIAGQSPGNAAGWIKGLYEQIAGLEEFPRRFGHAREQVHTTEEIRQIIFKSYRIIFTIDDAVQSVHIIHVRHTKMRAVGESDQPD